MAESPPAANGAGGASFGPKAYAAQSTVAELPGSSVILDAEVSGEEVARVFKAEADIPGIILARKGEFAGILSHSHFLRLMSLPYGREIYSGRPLSLMLSRIEYEPLVVAGSTRIEEAVGLALKRAPEYLYEPFVVYDAGREILRVCSFQVLLSAANQIASLRNEHMGQILSSVTDGLMLIDRDYVIGGEYSKALERILCRRAIAGRRLPDLLGEIVSPQVLRQVSEYLGVLFDRKLIDRLIKGINPVKEVEVRVQPENGGEPEARHFAFQFERIWADKEIRQILVRIEDISRRVALARKLEDQEAEAKGRLAILGQLMARPASDACGYLEAYTRLVGECRAIWEENEGGDRLRAVFRRVHKLKGDASLLRFTAYEEALHRFEEQLAAAGESPQGAHPEIRDGLERLASLGQTAQEALTEWSAWRQAASAAPADAPVPAMATGTRLRQRLEGIVAEVGRRQGKEARVYLMPEDPALPAEIVEEVSDILVQLARNAVVHGIEKPGIRRANGKPPEGAIQVAFECDEQTVEIIFQDDGAGLDLVRIRERAVAMGLPAATDEEAKRAIFAPGFSTAAQVDADAGRGVGMDVVWERLQERSGQILVHSDPGRYCAFQILLPVRKEAAV